MSDIDRCPMKAKRMRSQSASVETNLSEAFDAIVCVPSAGKDGWLTYSKPVDENDGEPISAPSWTFSSNALAAKKAYNP